MVAAIEGIAAAGMAAAVTVAAMRPDSRHVAPVAEVLSWVVVVAALALIWLGLYRRRRAARTPFLLVQCFALVAAWTFVSSDSLAWRLAGLTLGAMAVLGLVLSVRPAVSSALH